MAETVVSGAVLLPEGAVLTEGAQWTVELQDTSLADAPAVVIGQAGGAIADPLIMEIPFEIAYEASAILETNTYTLQARIVDSAGSLLYVNDTAIPVLTGGAPSEDVSVPGVAVPPAEAIASTVAEASMVPDATASPEASPAS
jgi:putative lipoprotein